MHPAQASDNAPAWHDRARFHRPTTPLTERGRPIGLGVNLDGTSTEPTTEDRRGPHHGRCRPRQICFAPEPVGCRFPSANTRGKSARFRAGQSRNPYPTHYRPAFAACPAGYAPPRWLALRLAYPRGRTTGLPRCIARILVG